MQASLIKTKKNFGRYIAYIFLTVSALTMVIPYAWMIVSSIKPIAESQGYPPSFYVRNPTFAPYRELFSLLPMWRYLLNSLFVASLVSICNPVFASIFAAKQVF